MSRQYLRNCSLVVAPDSGAGIELGALRVQFHVRRGDQQTPNTCDAFIYNLDNYTANLIAGKQPEFTQLILGVSYGDAPLATAFRGAIKQVRTGRIDQKDSYVAVTAADGDSAYNYSVSAFNLAAGSPPSNTVQRLIKDMVGSAQGVNGQAITQGPVPAFPSNRSLRGEVHYGSTRDEMREYVDTFDCKWSIQDGACTVIPKTGYVPEPAVLITPFTGLIGIPEQTQNGLAMRVLMNPFIKIGRTVKLSSSINQLPLGMQIGQAVTQNLAGLAAQLRINPDGLYYVMKSEHHGDTRGIDWYTDLTCLSVDATIPINNVFTTVQLAGAVPRY